jgi:hypothetical protein
MAGAAIMEIIAMLFPTYMVNAAAFSFVLLCVMYFLLVSIKL